MATFPIGIVTGGECAGPLLRNADIHVSHLSREKTVLLTRATEERAKTNIFRTRSSQRVPLGGGSCLRRTGHPCKSLSRENTVLLTRASEERAPPYSPVSAARTCVSRRWFLPSQNRTSIRCLGPLKAVTED